MTRTILSSLAVGALLSMAAGGQALSQSGISDWEVNYQAWPSTGKSAKGTRKPAPAVPRQLKSNRRAVPCDCTNCSAQHCGKTGDRSFFVDETGVIRAQKRRR